MRVQLLSSNEAKRLGKRLRDGSRSVEDMEMLETLRASYDPLLVESLFKIRELLDVTTIDYLIAGRSKRVKSIIRKLQRPQNKDMDLSRMADLVGLRIIVSDIKSQDELTAILTEGLDIKEVRDTRLLGTNYRSIHLIIREGGKQLEVQIRTLAQHIWSDESESFGEQVKEGGGEGNIKEYLEQLSKACDQLDQGLAVSEDSFTNDLMHSRKPIHIRYTRVKGMFRRVTSMDRGSSDNFSFIVVYDKGTNQLLKEDIFGPNEREDALKEYRRIVRTVDDTRYDVLILNSASKRCLPITHPRFFPLGV